MKRSSIVPHPKVPVRALVLSVLALLIPVAATLWGHGLLGDYAVMLWLLALVPAFLLAYYRGWRGVATALAAGMAALSLAQAILTFTERQVVNWPLLVGVVLAYMGVALGIGWVSELLHRERSLALQNAVDVTLVVGKDGLIRYASPSVRRVLGHEVDGLVGTPVEDWIHPDERVRLDVFRAARDEASVRHGVELRFRHADGTWRMLDALGINLQDDDAVGGVVLRARDVTERKQLQEQLRLTQRMQAVAKLAAGVAHEFNNILTTVEGHSRLLLEELPADDERRDDLATVLRATERASSLTWQLLAFTRQQVLRPRRVDLNELVRRAVNVLGRLAGDDMSIACALDENLSAVMADPQQIEQVVVNLVLRAREAMPAGGRVRIHTENQTIDAAFAARFPYFVGTGPYAVIEISDNGPRMSEEVRLRVFEPFTTLGQAGGGTGLELSSAYGIVKQTGGYIWVEDVEGWGTTFRVYLPRVEQAAEVAPEPARREAGPRRAGVETVLVVEDDPEVRSLVRRLLLHRGYSVLEASHGEEALALVEGYRNPIDLVITDVVMPGMTGRELASRMALRRPGTPVLLMSGYAYDDARDTPWAGGELDFLEKPFAPAVLAAKVREMLDRVAAS